MSVFHSCNKVHRTKPFGIIESFLLDVYEAYNKLHCCVCLSQKSTVHMIKLITVFVFFHSVTKNNSHLPFTIVIKKPVLYVAFR